MAIVARAFPGLTFGTTPSSAMDSTKRTLAKEAGLARCWQSFDVAASNVKITSEIKEEVRRHGIPKGIRADAYFALSGASSLQQEHANTYTSLAASTSNLSDEVIFGVEDDVRSARLVFKDSPLFATAKGAEVLSRLIFAYIQRNPACGYFKGLAHIAALLLATFGKQREEQAFWTLVALLERRLFPHCGGQVPTGSRVEVQVLKVLLGQRQPALAAQLAKLDSDAVESLCNSWLSTAFTRTLPQEVVLRIWDCVVVEGPKVALRTAMALIKMCGSSIQSCTTMPVLCRVVEGRLARHSDADALLSVAFKGLGSLSGSNVDSIRNRVLANMQSQQKTRSGLPAPLGAGAASSLLAAATASNLGANSTSSSGESVVNSAPRRSSSGGSSGSLSLNGYHKTASSGSLSGYNKASYSGSSSTGSRPASKQGMSWPTVKSTGALAGMA
ncbi:hypothetical protein Agub_g6741 [Astrephomene gubernaculifera]|uniref:Rab-GAP TBC domain-containing protein n=1 Tax=Astrephomene gubernaculifera TaxID=47775 RepID=A0AAD3HLV4_9CHLO|nr:hypothetical protein Agub_g6741 [Astrephomene gubernaculifera]